MKPLNEYEVENIVQELTELIGGRLQAVESTDHELGLGLYHNSEIHWLWIDLTPSNPVVLHLKELPQREFKKTPLQLFFSAHGKGLRLNALHRDEGAGRVVHFAFGSAPDPFYVEVRLFPHGENVIATKGSKRISYSKIQDLKPLKKTQDVMMVRSLEQIKREWMDQKSNKAEANPARKVRQLEKKKEGLRKLKEDLADKQRFQSFSEFGEWLKENQTLQVPEKFSDLVGRKLTLSENIEAAFSKAKSLKHKMEENQNRILELEKEIQRLEHEVAGGPEAKPLGQTQEPRERKLQTEKRKASGARYRTLKLEAPFEAYMGRSAKDNLLILREAQGWDIWLHLRDSPGAHVIIRRPKSKVVPTNILDQVVLWLVKETASKKFAKGDIVEVQMQEARFVRPIKGDKLGRVTVQTPKHRRVRL